MQATQEMLFRDLLDAIRKSGGVSVTVDWNGTGWDIRCVTERDGKTYGNRLAFSPADLEQWESERLAALIRNCVNAPVDA